MVITGWFSLGGYHGVVFTGGGHGLLSTGCYHWVVFTSGYHWLVFTGGFLREVITGWLSRGGFHVLSYGWLSRICLSHTVLLSGVALLSHKCIFRRSRTKSG